MPRARSQPSPPAKAVRAYAPGDGFRGLLDAWAEVADRAIAMMLAASAERDQLLARLAVLEERADPPKSA